MSTDPRAQVIEELKRTGLPQTQIASLLDLEQATISRWFSGKKRPDYDSLIRVARAFPHTALIIIRPFISHP